MAALIQRLPVELIAQIFIEVGHLEEWHGYGDLLQSLLAVSSVCSRWRTISLATPMLWATFHLSPLRSSASISSVTSRVQAHLDRSRSVSIDVHYNVSMFHSIERPQAIWKLIVPHLYRCRRIELFGLTHESSNYILPLSKSGQLNRLETLQLSAVDISLNMEHLFGDEDDAPKLFDLSLTGIVLSAMPVPSITHLTLHHHGVVGWSYVLASLALFPHLENVTLRFGLQAEVPQQQPLVLPNLTTLFIYDSRFHQYLSTPKLEHLGCSSFHGEVDLEQLPPLKRLTLIHPTREALEEWDLTHAVVAGLHTLDLIRCPNSDFFFDLLLKSPSGAAPKRFPLLRKLSLKHSQVNNPMKDDVRRSIFKLLDARPELVIESDSNSLRTSSKPIKWSQLHKKSGGRLSELDPRDFQRWN